MRQFILAKTFQATTANLDALADGAVGVYDLSTGVPKQLTYSNSVVTNAIKSVGCLAVGTAKGTVTIPLHANKFSFVEGVYTTGSKFSQKITIVKRGTVGDYTVIVAKKGQPCNERYKWTASYHVFDPDMTADDIAASLAKEINNSCAGAGVTATVATNVITVSGTETGIDYSIVLADNANLSTLSALTTGKKAIFDAEAIKDMYMKAAADAGIEYTYQNGTSLIYPNYPLRQDAAMSVGYKVITLKFAEARAVGTTDEVVNQVVQVAFPSTVDTAAFKAVLGAIG
jgi:hypothetical protein